MYVINALVTPSASLWCLSHGAESACKIIVTKVCARRGGVISAWQMGTLRHRWGFMTQAEKQKPRAATLPNLEQLVSPSLDPSQP